MDLVQRDSLESSGGSTRGREPSPDPAFDMDLGAEFGRRLVHKRTPTFQLRPDDVLFLQRSVGNRTVARVIASAAASRAGPAPRSCACGGSCPDCSPDHHDGTGRGAVIVDRTPDGTTDRPEEPPTPSTTTPSQPDQSVPQPPVGPPGPQVDGDDGPPGPPNGQRPDGAAPDGQAPNQAPDSQPPVGPAPDGPTPDSAALDESVPGDDAVHEERRPCEPNPEYVALVEEWGEPGSPERQAKIDEAYANADGFDNFVEGFATGGGLGLLGVVAESGVARMLATRGVSQAAKAAGPVGAILGGIVGGVSLYKKGWSGIGAGLTFQGWNEGQGDELTANRWNAVAEFLDVLGAIADVIAGVAGAIALGGTIIGLIPGGQWALPAVPIAAKVAFWGGIVGLACTVMKGIAQQVSREYREKHLLNMELAGEAEMLHQQQQLTAQAEAGYQFLGGMAGAGTVAAGQRATPRARQARARARAEAEGRPVDPHPLEPTVVEARQRATPEELGRMQAVDDAVAGQPPRSQGTEPEVTRPDPEAARDAQERLADAEQRRAATDDALREAEVEARAKQDALDRAEQRVEEARAEQRQTSGERDRLLEQDARAEAARSTVQDKLDATHQAEARTRDAQAEVNRLEAEVERWTTVEAQALEPAPGRFNDQLALELARSARRRADAAAAELEGARAELEARRAAESAARDEYLAVEEATRDITPPSDERMAESTAAADDARARLSEAEQARDQARIEASQAEWDRTAQENQHRVESAGRRADVDAARERLAEAEEQQARWDDATAGESQRNMAPDGSGRVREEVPGAARETVEGGGTAQDLLGDPYEDPEARETRVPVPCLGPPAPTSSAEVERDNALADQYQSVADEASAQEEEADSERVCRESDAASLETLDSTVEDRRRDTTETSRGLDAMGNTRTTLEATQGRIGGSVDQMGEKVSDLTSFASFVGRMLGFARRLDNDLFPDSIRNAGRSIAEKGDQVAETTSGTTQEIASQRAGRGAEQQALATGRAGLESSQTQIGSTESTIDQSSGAISEMRQGNAERQAVAQASAAANRQAAEQANEQAAATRARRDNNRAALDAWAAENRAAREQAIADTTASLEENGYEVTGVRGE